MSKRALWFAITRPKVFTFALIGAGLFFWGAPPMAGAIMFAIAAWRAGRILSYNDLNDRLRLRDDKQQHGIHRMLSDSERDEIFAIDHYARLLEEKGARPELARESLNHAWSLIREAGREDATARLKNYRHSLPPLRDNLSSGRATQRDVAADIQKELDLIRATERELSLVG